jgi:hypothetical protein
MHLQEPEFFWFTSDAFLKRHVLSFQDSYVKFLQGDLRAKVVPEGTTRDRKKLKSGVRARGVIKFTESGKFKLAIFHENKS